MTPKAIRSTHPASMHARLTYAPTRNPRLNEMLGLIVCVAALLLLLALVSYSPSDPSFNTVGGASLAAPATPIHATGPAARLVHQVAHHLAHNWMGVFGAFLSDLLLQAVGVAILFVPLLLARLGITWMRSRSFGSLAGKLTGLALWLLFAPVAIALLPGHLLWRGAVPLSGVAGQLLAEMLLAWINLPGTIALCALMVLLSLYLTTTFTLFTAGEWANAQVGPLRALKNRWRARRLRRQFEQEEQSPEFRSELAPQPVSQATQPAAEVPEERSLLGGFFRWFSRRRQPDEGLSLLSADAAPVAASVWQQLPRTQADAPRDSLAIAAAAAAPLAAELAHAAAPMRSYSSRTPSLPFAGADSDAALTEDDNWLDAPERRTPPSLFAPAAVPVAATPAPLPQPIRRSAVAQPLPPMPSPTANLRDQTGVPDARSLRVGVENIAFGIRADANLQAVVIAPKSIRGYKLPPSSLLFHSEERAVVRETELREEAHILEKKCAEFGVDGQVTQINPGPVVTTFEFKPDAGVKVARITSLADDLCLAMAAESILIERMSGKSTVGIQVPNRERETIWLRDVVECESFAQSRSRLPVALGKDISGNIVTGDLAAMPHVLIAGSTGSGKSVAINAMIMSVLYKSTPEQVRMILVDPKRVELGMYEGIPHLFTPIITEAKLAANALRNAVREMERRLKLLAANHVRNIDQFNKLFEHGSEYLFEDTNQEPLPYIMIIIDELADLMMLDRSNVEEAITRLAQMARAVGIHLVLATQRPSVDVITGLIKANVPTRMSFRLATKVDSRTIIDANGAESLLGRGDMLFLPPGTSRLQRVHAPYVTEKEIAAVTAFWREQGQAEYVEGFLEGPKDDKSADGSAAKEGDDNDPMFDDAVRLIFEFGKASTSLLQRRLRIGYGRAAHLIDLMERDGLVGPADGSKPREILKAPSYYQEVDAALR